MKLKQLSMLALMAVSLTTFANTQSERMLQEQSRLLLDYQRQLTNLQAEVDQLRGDVQRTQYELKQAVQTQKGLQTRLDSLENTASTAPAITLSGDVRQDYENLMMSVLLEQSSPSSLDRLLAYQQAYPESDNAPTITYWLGQVSDNLGQKEEASVYFARVVKDYPQSDKAGISLAKLGKILQESGDKEKAKAIYQRVLSAYSDQKEAVQFSQQQLQTL